MLKDNSTLQEEGSAAGNILRVTMFCVSAVGMRGRGFGYRAAQMHFWFPFGEENCGETHPCSKSVRKALLEVEIVVERKC